MTKEQINAMDVETFISFAESCKQACRCDKPESCDDRCGGIIRRERRDRVVYTVYGGISQFKADIVVLPVC